jgi:hypothetical protein
VDPLQLRRLPGPQKKALQLPPRFEFQVSRTRFSLWSLNSQGPLSSYFLLNLPLTSRRSDWTIVAWLTYESRQQTPRKRLKLKFLFSTFQHVRKISRDLLHTLQYYVLRSAISGELLTADCRGAVFMSQPRRQQDRIIQASRLRSRL